MKILAIGPGRVYKLKEGSQWWYTLRYLGATGWQTVRGGDCYVFASDAKQAMREHVARERKRHKL